jgi:hypothetical protein
MRRFTAALQNIHSFDDNGMLAGSDPGAGKPAGFQCSPDGYLNQ